MRKRKVINMLEVTTVFLKSDEIKTRDWGIDSINNYVTNELKKNTLEDVRVIVTMEIKSLTNEEISFFETYPMIEVEQS
jgi:hypothetical protein